MAAKHRQDDEDSSAIFERQTPETNVTFSLWAVISLIIVLFASFAAYAFNCLADHSNRLTKTETSFEFIAQKLNTIDQRLVQHMDEKRTH
jgi:hypothetical protein